MLKTSSKEQTHNYSLLSFQLRSVKCYGWETALRILH